MYLRQSAAARGMVITTIDNSAVGGACMSTTAGPSNNVEQQRQAVLDGLPDRVILHAGSNDCASGGTLVTPTEFDAAVKDHVEFFLGLGAYSGHSYAVPFMVLDTITTRTNVAPGFESVWAAFNEKIEAIPAWLASTYPAAAGRVVVCDAFTAWGGDSAPASYFKNQTDLLHPGPAGYAVLGGVVAAALAETF